MPRTQRQRRAACARASGSTRVMKGMSKAKAAKWCHAKKLHKPKKKGR